jgi:hypothetical protein
MNGVVRKISLASALLGAGVWMLVIAGPVSVAPAHAQTAAATPDASATDNSSPDVSTPDALILDLNGQWSGTIIDDNLGSGDLSVNILQNQKNHKKFTLSWSAEFTSVSYQGQGDGKATSRKVDFDLTSGSFTEKHCKAVFKSTSADGGSIQGNYKWVNCGKQFGDSKDKGGTISIQIQPAM